MIVTVPKRFPCHGTAEFPGRGLTFCMYRTINPTHANQKYRPRTFNVAVVLKQKSKDDLQRHRHNQQPWHILIRAVPKIISKIPTFCRSQVSFTYQYDSLDPHKIPATTRCCSFITPERRRGVWVGESAWKPRPPPSIRAAAGSRSRRSRVVKRAHQDSYSSHTF